MVIMMEVLCCMVAAAVLVVFVIALIVGPVARPGTEVQVTDKAA